MFYKKIINKILNKFGYQIQKIDTKLKLPIEFSQDELNLVTSIEDYTMTGRIRIISIINLYKDIINREVEGDFVECGVWRGGNLILVQKLNEIHQQKKNIFGFDTFEGMTKPNEFDFDLRNENANNLLNKTKKLNNVKNIWAYCDLDTVQDNINKILKQNNIKLIKGDVKNTLKIKENLPEKISMLRLDTDFYESTKIELEVLYPRLSKGGVLIIDDYGHFKGCKKAVDEFFENSNNVLHYIDYSARYLVKR
tara:strand:+ start:132 stop:887 length:756 start_codon:yes stop_codon:yes gene_type:complete